MDILGLNYSFDSAAALVRDGRVIAASQEERFVRAKHYAGFPVKAIEFCLERSGKSLADLDAVAFFWNPGITAEAPVRRFTSSVRHHLEFLHSVPTNLKPFLGDARIELLEQVLHLDSGRKVPIYFVTHHLCHAAAAFWTSPFDEAAILTADGYGERQSTLIAHGKGTDIEPVLSVDFPHSLGALYAAITQYLGFRPNSGEGKVMGLASYGKPSEAQNIIRDMVRLTDKGFELDLTAFEYFHDRERRYNERLIDLLGPERKPESGLEQRHMDVAFALQEVTEEALSHLARLAREKTGCSNLCVAGGVGLNCVANGRLAREALFDEFFFYPAASDAGAAVGAAMLVAHRVLGENRSGEVASEYLGPSYSRDEVRAALKKTRVEFEEVPDAEGLAARLISEGRIIGWFQGGAEFGPRALGNRSILADPRQPDMKDRLNSTVKFRESFRPYAPSVLEEASGDFFSCPTPSPYMLRAYSTLPDKIDVLPSITHVDGTARVQTVRQDQNPRYYKLIRALGDITGVPVVLNTSFNIRGEPIVHTVEDALKCFFTTGIDALFIDNFVLFKREAKPGSE